MLQESKMMLSAQYPTNETNKEVVFTSTIFGLFLYLLLIIYQPFGTSQFEHSHKYLLLFPYAIIAAFAFCCINLLIRRQQSKWTIGSELFKVFLILVLISSLSYLYNTLLISKVNLSLENYLYMFAYTSALGLPVATIYILARYIYLKNKPLANTTKSGNKSIIKSKYDIEINEGRLKQKLCVVPDYGKFSLEIQQDEFVFAESADNYCILFFYNNGILQKEIIRISLTKLLNQIQNDTIKKVHRSFIVNLKKVAKFKGNASGYKISIENIEKELTISRNYIDSVLPVLKNLAART